MQHWAEEFLNHANGGYEQLMSWMGIRPEDMSGDCEGAILDWMDRQRGQETQ